MTITAETEIKALPTKEQMIKQIPKEAYEAKMDAIDAKIAVLRTESKLLHSKRKEVIDGGKMQGSSMTYRETLNS